MQDIAIAENGLFVNLEVTDAADVRFLHFGATPLRPETIGDEQQRSKCRLLELQATGEDQNDHHGSRYTGTAPASRLRYAQHRDYRTAQGRKLEIEQHDNGLIVTSHMQFFDDLPVARCWTQVDNRSDACVGLEYVTSFCLAGLAKETEQQWDTCSRLHVPHNGTYGEMQWKGSPLPDLGLCVVSPNSTIKRLAYTSNGTWPGSTYLPMGCYENTEAGSMLFWQIEHLGSWHWEIGNVGRRLYVALSGPTQNENHWWKDLASNQSFTSVAATVGAVCGGIEEVFGQLTRYRRRVRRVSEDNRRLPVVFDDYMHCLFADPTTAKLLPLIDAAAAAGCEIFCIDAGWYGDEDWYNQVGEWKPCAERFPKGLNEPLDYIRAQGLVPGLWIEPEVMATGCARAAQVPDDWFFMRHGRRVIDHSRFQLDFRNAEVLAYVDEVVDRLVGEYGIGYLKIDYNINAGIGTETSADSFGDGLLQHNEAYLAWLDRVIARYPDLIMENCASGGMRLVQPLLSRHSIHSISDQTDYDCFAPISAAVPTAVPPEQAAVWSYPKEDDGRDAVVFNMVNSLLLRVYLSGPLDRLGPAQLSLVREAIGYYGTIRADIQEGLPFWPLGLPSFGDAWIGQGLHCGDRDYLAVWRMAASADTCLLPIRHRKGQRLHVDIGYPRGDAGDCRWEPDAGVLRVALPHALSARVIELHAER